MEIAHQTDMMNIFILFRDSSYWESMYN